MLLCVAARAQNDSTLHRGRKYKAPPPTSHIEVIVLRGYNGKPVENAAVVFHSVKDDQDEGNLEVKTNEAGTAMIDVIPVGSKVRVQIIADGFATYADDYQVNEANRTITVKMLRPRAQVSTYTDNGGKPSPIQPGIQEPNHPSSPAVVQPPPPASVDPNATPGNPANSTPKPNGTR